MAQKYYIPINFIGSGSSTEEKNPDQHPYCGKSVLLASVIDIYVSSLVNRSVASSLTAGKWRSWAEADDTLGDMLRKQRYSKGFRERGAN